jgi:hypothetical protein
VASLLTTGRERPQAYHFLGMQLLSSFDRRRPRTSAGVRIAVGIWLAIGGAIACDNGYWWGLVILLPAALNFYLAYRTLKAR